MANRPRNSTIEVNNLQMHIQEWGDDRSKHALVLLHGYAETLGIWEEVAIDLSREFRVIGIDIRGHGQSDLAPDMDYSRSAQVADLEALVEQMGLESVTLIGQAMGGATAICYAAEHPDIARALIVIETAPEVLRSGVETLRRLLGSRETFATMDEATDLFHEFYPYATGEQLDRRVRNVVTAEEAGGYRWAFDPIFLDPTARPPEPDPGQRRMTNLWESVERVQCPTMIVRGAETDMLTPEAIQRLHRRIIGSRVSLIEDAGHAVVTDQPGTLSQHIREFLQSLTLTAG